MGGPANFVERLGQAKAKGIKVVSTADAKKLVQNKALVIDVRDSGDIGDGIEGAINIPLSNLVFAACQDFALPDDVKVNGEVKIPKTHEFCDKRLKGSKDKPILVSCGLGGQALIGGGILADYGYTNVSVVDGGNIAWINGGGKVCDCMK